MTQLTKIVAGALIIGAASSAVAAETGPKVTLTGDLDTQAGYKSQKAHFDTTAANEKLNKYAIVNDTNVKVKVDGNAKGLKYGGLVSLNADTSDSKFGSNNVARQTMAYVEHSLGRVEAGNYTGAYAAMQTNGATGARATGGINGDMRFWINLGDNANRYIIAPALPTAYGVMDRTANAAKVTYYTPSFGGFKAGLTFIPDTAQSGTVTTVRGVAANFTDGDSRFTGYKNVFQGGIMYANKINKFDVRASAVGEMGDAKKVAGVNTLSQRHDLRAYEIGASVGYNGFAVAASFGDWGKSGSYKSIYDTVAKTTSKVEGKKSSKYWTAGVNYAAQNFGASLTYLNAESHALPAVVGYSTKKAETDVISFGVDYKVAPGFMPYAEVSHFNMKDKSLAAGQPGNKNSGMVVLAGTKISF